MCICGRMAFLFELKLYSDEGRNYMIGDITDMVSNGKVAIVTGAGSAPVSAA